MKKFKFRLGKLLDLRTAQERRIKNELAELVHIQNIERNKQNELRQRILEGKKALRNKFERKIFSYNDIIMHERFTDTANKAINIAEQKIQEMEPRIQLVRERLIEASKAKKVVERLKEKRYSEYLYNTNREIVKENDDINQKLFLKHRTDNFYQ